MTESTKTKPSTELSNSLLKAADALRSKMDANDYKNYLLGIIFYKYLSDELIFETANLMGEDQQTISAEEAQELYEKNYDNKRLQDELFNILGFKLQPKYTFTNIMKHIQDHTFQITDLSNAFQAIEGSSEVFEGLFDDVDLFSSRLGNNAQKQTDTISKVLLTISDIELVRSENDVLGDAYEYLIGEFASETGKKAGEFYTPQEVSQLLTRLTLVGKDYSSGMTVYDPAMGSGSLLLNFKKFASCHNSIRYYGQEINTSTYNLARMNMILHKVPNDNQELHNADTLDADWPTSEITDFDAVVMNPPYSQHWSANEGFLDDPRFSKYGVLAPKSKADYAFLLHGFYHLKNSGTMAIVLPHGVLFRGGKEGKIRQKLLEDGSIDAVIGLPANLFYNTSIPTAIIVLKKGQKAGRDVMFIDASKGFAKEKRQNKLREEDIEKILKTYEERKDVKRYAHLASFDEIKENDFNLNIPRYVDTFVPEPPVDLGKLTQDMKDTQAEIDQNEKELLGMMKELTSSDEKTQNDLNSFIQMLEGEVKKND